MRPHRIVLLSEDWPQVPYLAEALERVGCPVVLVHPHDAHPLLNTYRRFHCVEIASTATKDLAPVLAALCAETPDCRIVALSDELLANAWRCAPDITACLYPQLPASHLALLGDKAKMSVRAREAGLTIPAFAAPRHADEALAFAREHGFPVVVKGATGVGGRHVRIVRDEASLLAGLAELADDHPVVQQFIAGPTVLAGGLFDRGRALRLQLCEKTQLHPPQTGPSIRIRSMASSRCAQQVESLMHDLGWSGLASMDFVWDGQTFYFLELNPRPWGCITAAHSAGIDFYDPWAQLMHGEAVQPDLRGREGVDACVFPAYLFHLADQGSLTSLATGLAGPAFWRGVPPASWRLFVYFARRSVWNLLLSKQSQRLHRFQRAKLN